MAPTNRWGSTSEMAPVSGSLLKVWKRYALGGGGGAIWYLSSQENVDLEHLYCCPIHTVDQIMSRTIYKTVNEIMSRTIYQAANQMMSRTVYRTAHQLMCRYWLVDSGILCWF